MWRRYYIFGFVIALVPLVGGLVDGSWWIAAVGGSSAVGCLTQIRRSDK
jgi:hypothetical protein